MEGGCGYSQIPPRSFILGIELRSTLIVKQTFLPVSGILRMEAEVVFLDRSLLPVEVRDQLAKQ
jgi:hypothetical protein